MRDKIPASPQTFSSGGRSSRSYGMFKEAVNYAYFHPGTQIFVACAKDEHVNKVVKYAPKVLEALKVYPIGYTFVDISPVRKHIELENGSRIIIGLIEGGAGREFRAE